MERIRMLFESHHLRHLIDKHYCSNAEILVVTAVVGNVIFQSLISGWAVVYELIGVKPGIIIPSVSFLRLPETFRCLSTDKKLSTLDTASTFSRTAYPTGTSRPRSS